MDKFQTIKNVLVKYLKRLSTLFVATLVFTYFLAMAVIPFYRGNYSWDNMQEVWHSWQGLNVGMLAFFSTFFLYKAAVYREEEKRKRDFKTAKAFLPSALGQLNELLKLYADYTNDYATYLESKRHNPYLKKTPKQLQEDLQENLLKIKPTTNNYEDIFRKCIKNAEPKVAEYLSGTIIRLQMLNTRLFSNLNFIDTRKNLSDDNLSGDIKMLTKNIIEVGCFVYSLWSYAGGEIDFEITEINPQIVDHVIKNLGIKNYHDSSFPMEVAEHIKNDGILGKI